MAVYFDSQRGTYYSSCYYKDSNGNPKRKVRRGFKTHKEAVNWEKRFQYSDPLTTDSTFGEITEIYLEDMKSRVRRSSMQTKRSVIEKKILPYFRNLKIAEITPLDIRKWQDKMIGGGYSPTYLRTIQEQISAVFNYAVKFYGLSRNPCTSAGSMGKSNAGEMEIWTIDEFNTFLRTVDGKPEYHVAFMILFWTGMRLGEMLALTYGDIDFTSKTVRINKSLQRIQGEDVITEPKTPKSNRVIQIPDLLISEIRSFLDGMPPMKPEDRLIAGVSKNSIERELKRGIYSKGLPDIHPHCLRHSHTALIAALGASPVEAAERLGHENVSTTLNVYSHVMPGRQAAIACELDKLYQKSKNR